MEDFSKWWKNEKLKRVKKDLEDRVKNVFGGDLCEAVYVLARGNGTDKELIKDCFNNERDLRRLNIRTEGVDFVYDHNDLIIEFKNGRKVLFAASEWARIELMEG